MQTTCNRTSIVKYLSLALVSALRNSTLASQALSVVICVSILFTLIALIMMLAVALFIYSVLSAPIGTESAEGFALESGVAAQTIPESIDRFEAVRDGMTRISVIKIAGS